MCFPWFSSTFLCLCDCKQCFDGILPCFRGVHRFFHLDDVHPSLSGLCRGGKGLDYRVYLRIQCLDLNTYINLCMHVCLYVLIIHVHNANIRYIYIYDHKDM